jgi:hypothetical protein
MRTYKIAITHKLDDFNIIGDKCKVAEELFWQNFTDKIKQITADQPEKYEETLQKAKEALYKSSLTIIDTWFQITGKDESK